MGRSLQLTWLVIASLLVIVVGCATPPSQQSKPKAVEHYVRAVKAKQAGDERSAISALTLALIQNPDLTMAHVMLGDLYRGEEEYEQALPQYLATIRLDPYYYENYYKLGLTYQMLERLREAETSYRKSLELNPTDLKTTMNLGLVYLALGQTDDAVKYVQHATELDPSFAVAYANLGVALDAKGNHAAAEAAYRRSLDLDANQPPTLMNLGTNLLAQQKPQEAVSTLEQVVRMADSPLARKRLGDAYAMAKQYDQALSEYQSVLKESPQYYPALNEIGRVMIAQYVKGLELDDNQRKAALDAWNNSLKINADQPRIKQLLAQWSGDPMIGTRGN